MSPLTPHARRLLGEADWIRRLARHLVVDEHHADDLEQETWARALGSPPQPGRPVRPWLYTVMANLVRRRVRSERAARDRERVVACPEATTDTLHQATHHELQRLLVHEVMALDEPFRGTVLHRYYDDLACADIARQEGVPPGTVRWRLKRGLDTLRERLDRRHEGDRRAWILALAPLAAPAPTAILSSALLSKVAAVVLMGAGVLGAWKLWPETPTPDTPSIAGIVAPRTESITSSVVPQRTLDEPAVRDLPRSRHAGLRQLRVMDRRGQALPDFQFRIESSDADSRTFRTDEDGWVSVAGLRDSDSLTPEDHPELAHQWGDQVLDVSGIDLLDHERGEVQITPGPTFVLDLRIPPEITLDDLTAVIVVPRPDGDPEPRVNCSAPLRGGRQPWVRFGPRLEQGIAAFGSPLTLVIRDRVGHYAGSVTVPFPLPESVTALPVTVTRRAVLRGTVLGEDGQPLQDAFVDLQRSATRVRFLSGVPGHFVIPWVEPGPHRLLAWSLQHPIRERMLALEPGDNTLSIQLESGVPCGAIHGTVTSQTGTFHERSSVRLVGSGEDGQGRVYTTDVEWIGDEDRKIGSYRLENVPHGEYWIEVRSNHYHRWLPRERTVTVPDRVDFTCLDEGGTVDLAFQVEDAMGQPLERFGLRYTLGDGRSIDAGQRSAREPVIRALPLDLGIDCYVYAPGHAVWHGTLAAFETRMNGAERPLLVAKVRLRHGWSALFRVSGPGQVPILGADVWLDDTYAGRTDERGHLSVHCDQRPDKVRVDYRGWTLRPAEGPGIAVPFEEIWNEVRLTMSP